MKKVVICLTKYPEVGKVKTRLGKTIGMDKSCLVQKEFIKEIVKNNCSLLKQSLLLDKSYDFLFCLKGENKIDIFCNEFDVNDKDVFLSKGDDLGEVMSYIFESTLKKYDEVILIGSDIPDLTNIDFLNGFDVLRNNDIVIGPTFDGGYYLIGMKKNNKKVFENIVYSTNTVFDETIEKFKQNNLSFGLLDKKRDIDTYEDLKKSSEENKFLEKIKNNFT